MDRIKTYAESWNRRREESFWLDLAYKNADLSLPSHVIIRCRSGVQCDVPSDSAWSFLRTRIFTKTKKLLQVVSDREAPNREQFTAHKNGKLTLVLKADPQEFTNQQVQEFLLNLEKVLTEVLPEYVVA